MDEGQPRETFLLQVDATKEHRTPHGTPCPGIFCTRATGARTVEVDGKSARVANVELTCGSCGARHRFPNSIVRWLDE